MNLEQKQKIFKELYKENHLHLEKYCRALIRDEEQCKEMMCEAIAIAYEQFEKIRDLSKFKHFLFGICSNLFKKHLKDKGKRVEMDLVSNRPADTEQFHKNDVDFLYECLSKLNPPQGEIVALFELSGFKLLEIAEMKSIPLSTVKTHLYRGKEALKTLILQTEKTF
ncbi:MAG TPA: RNA polymerase sigma factor [Bacteroidia bacterium]